MKTVLRAVSVEDDSATQEHGQNRQKAAVDAKKRPADLTHQQGKRLKLAFPMYDEEEEEVEEEVGGGQKEAGETGSGDDVRSEH